MIIEENEKGKKCAKKKVANFTQKFSASNWVKRQVENWKADVEDLGFIYFNRK